MIRFEVKWRNFRGFEDTGWIPICPITVLIGSNNTGKSSFMAPLLLLKQTNLARSGDVPLISRGEFENVGGFRDFVHRHEIDRVVSFGLRWGSQEPDGSEPSLGSVPPGEVELQFSMQNGSLVLSQFEVRDAFRRIYLTRSLTSSGRYSLRNLPKSSDPNASAFERRIDKAARQERPTHFLFDGESVLDLIIKSRGDRPSSEEDTSDPFQAMSAFTLEYWNVVYFTSLRVQKILNEVSYLGPLREPLRRVYELSGDPPRDVGTRGEHAPEVLFLNKSLLNETRSWLRFFGLGRSLRPTTGKDDSFSLSFPAGGGRPSVNVADVGFGASQILPMIVQGLSAPPGSLLAMEQPEIHLNPRLQSRIADFFVDMASSKKGVLVETHSEHLLLRLRTLLAKGDLTEEDIAVYFVDRKKGKSFIRPIPIDNGGFIKPANWPRGFFQDSARESLALAIEQNKINRNAR